MHEGEDPPSELRLTASERRLLASLEQVEPSRALKSWRRFVQDLPEGSTQVDDYCYHLYQRDELQKVIDAAPRSIAVRLSSALRELDHAFSAATVTDERQVLRKFFNHSDRWWWCRIPARGTLREYLDDA